MLAWEREPPMGKTNRREGSNNTEGIAWQMHKQLFTSEQHQLVIFYAISFKLACTLIFLTPKKKLPQEWYQILWGIHSASFVRSSEF